ncbi:hypothetical protein VP01_34g6 [Puccinia sorghi]|uniref:Uncharacterized protein n=1 Tax=Puccinia sorghi TaxID=27349 RepID=A0A0L6UWI3_9BASI|nr:hypothetical protein VP01_34g6 [Puccinia sorghi]
MRASSLVAITALFNILQAVLEHSSPSQILEKIPRDPRTLMLKAVLKPTLVATPCCRTCFSLYPVTPLPPPLCTYQPFQDSSPCNEELWIQKSTHCGLKDLGQFQRWSDFHPAKIGVLQCQFFTQPITAWLEWLLEKPEIELAIDTWSSEVRNSNNNFGDIQHGAMFRGLSSDNAPSILNLSLSLFVDWFNPQGNKISGKHESMGVFAISCMNLPPNLRNKIPYICLAGVTPGPYSADKDTINHLLKPIVDELISLDSGVIMKTHQYPRVGGFASPTATRYCTWCLAQCQALQNLELGVTRKREETISAAKNSKTAASADAQDTILKNTGVRWSELNRLNYWDPSQQIALGIMHNWLEGVLQSHWRYRWRFIATAPRTTQKRSRPIQQNQATMMKMKKMTYC